MKTEFVRIATHFHSGFSIRRQFHSPTLFILPYTNLRYTYLTLDIPPFLSLSLSRFHLVFVTSGYIRRRVLSGVFRGRSMWCLCEAISSFLFPSIHPFFHSFFLFFSRERGGVIFSFMYVQHWHSIGFASIFLFDMILFDFIYIEKDGLHVFFFFFFSFFSY